MAMPNTNNTASTLKAAGGRPVEGCNSSGPNDIQCLCNLEVYTAREAAEDGTRVREELRERGGERSLASVRRRAEQDETGSLNHD
jgi:hypothetical protein